MDLILNPIVSAFISMNSINISLIRLLFLTTILNKILNDKTNNVKANMGPITGPLSPMYNAF